MTIDEEVPETLPGFGEFSEAFVRGGVQYVLFGTNHDAHWELRRAEGGTAGHIARTDDGFGYIHGDIATGAAARATDWRDLVRLYT